MFKKIILFFTILFSLYFYYNISYAEVCTDTSNIACSDYLLNVNDISPGRDIDTGTTQENTNNILSTIIQLLMIVLGSISLLIMTVGAGYIILHSGQDELLSKGKLIFTSGIYALLIALSSYYIVDLVTYILYKF